MFENLRGQVEKQNAQAGSSGRGHHRLCQRHSERRAQRRRRAGRNRRPHRIGAEVLRRSARHRGCGRAGYQADRPAQRPREGFQAEHAVLGGQRLLPAIHRRRLWAEGRAVCRSGFLRASHAGFRLRLRGVHAVRHRELPAPGLAGGRNSRRPGRCAAQERISLRGQHSQPGRSGSRFVLQGGTQNNLAVVKAEVDFIRSSFRAAGKQPEIIVHEHCGESGAIGAAQESLRVCGATGRRPPLSAWMRCARSNTAPRATKIPAATSARTTACGPSLTSAPSPRTTSASCRFRRSPKFR